jgi:hypothetical protein
VSYHLVSQIFSVTTHHYLHKRRMRGTPRILGLDHCPRRDYSICLVSKCLQVLVFVGHTHMHTLGLDDLITSSSSPPSLACHWFSSSESALLDSSLSLDLASEESLATSSPS